MVSSVFIFVLLSTALPALGCGKYYSVKSGDTGNLIASNNGITFTTLSNLNPGVNWNNLQIGQTLCVAADGATTKSPTTTPAAGGIVGWWRWTWSSGAVAPSGCNLGVAFSGYTAPSSAISNSAGVKSSLPNSKYISLGGGNAQGSWSSSLLTDIKNAINNNSFSGYVGLVYDIEEGTSGLYTGFANAFAAAKAKGFKNLVTISHSIPYGVSDASSLMTNILKNTNVDYISPQLYTSGSETQNDYTEGAFPWTNYKNTSAQIIPSIVRASLYSGAKSFFAGKNITTKGFVQWAQN
jgi:hypothetical protein